MKNRFQSLIINNLEDKMFGLIIDHVLVHRYENIFSINFYTRAYYLFNQLDTNMLISDNLLLITLINDNLSVIAHFGSELNSTQRF